MTLILKLSPQICHKNIVSLIKHDLEVEKLLRLFSLHWVPFSETPVSLKVFIIKGKSSFNRVSFTDAFNFYTITVTQGHRTEIYWNKETFTDSVEDDTPEEWTPCWLIRSMSWICSSSQAIVTSNESHPNDFFKPIKWRLFGFLVCVL